ncbi:Ulp1-like peptidase [Cucumis melo var. makuwa]|uniref:Ulp1-like peptidase n=1 Tax=Cucumis melo var. makuwa TaxID=1194695 RepID=A0A5A7TD66_CUCMM|nr:Ulp1-like peptidase [Cucumis melo var. makuwa]
MDDTITKQSLELYEMKQMLERLVQGTSKECGSDISIDGRDADLLMTIRDISDSLSDKIQKETDLPQMITTLPLETTKKQVEIQKNDEAVTLVQNEPVTVPNKDEQEKPIKRRKLCKIENKKVEDEDEQGNPPTTSAQIISESKTPVPDAEIREVDRYNPIQWICYYPTCRIKCCISSTFASVLLEYYIPRFYYVITCINIKEHWLAIAADMRKCKIYVFDSMPNYVEQKLVDEALQMPARCIPSLAIAIGVNLHSDHFTYGTWLIRRSKATLQKGRSLDCGIFCSKFVECLVTGSDLGCLTVPNMKLFRQQYVLELWANKYFC